MYEFQEGFEYLPEREPTQTELEQIENDFAEIIAQHDLDHKFETIQKYGRRWSDD